MTNQNPNADRWRKNQEHWNEVANAKNVGTSEAEVPWETERRLYRSKDVRDGYEFLEPLAGRIVVDLGGGVGLSAHDFLDRGALVVIVDVSIARCQKAQARLVAAGFAGRIQCVVAEGQRLPLASRSVDRLWTKSVLIHTPLAQTASELARVLKPKGKAWFIEPMRRNPFVNLYRWLKAPKIWAEITTYFSPTEFQLVRKAFTRRSFFAKTHRYFFLGFFAFVFSFIVSSPPLFRASEWVLYALDCALFRLIPGLKSRAWFGVLAINPQSKRATASRRSAPK